MKLLWPNRSRNRFFLETDTCNLYYYTIGMKKWQHVWRLYGDELASVFYDDDPSDEFRTDRIYLLTKNGHLLSCEAVVGHLNGQETLDISAFSCMMSVFPGVDIVDFLITRSFKRQFTAVELNALSEELSTSYEFLESVWEKSKSKPDMWPEIDEKEKEKGNMFYSCREIANDLQKLFFFKQEQLNELVKTLQSIVVTEPLKKKDKKKADKPVYVYGLGASFKDSVVYITEVQQVDSVVLEGGGQLNWSALEEGVVQLVQAYVAPKLFGGSQAKSPISGLGVELPAQAVTLKNTTITQLGEDFLLESEVEPCVHRDH